MQMAKVVSPNDSQTTDPNKNAGNSTWQSYFAALALVGAVIPIPFLTALVTVFVYLSPSPYPDPKTLPQVSQVFKWLGAGNTVLLLGLIITFIVWLLIALPCRYYATAKGGRPSDYESLKREFDILTKQLELVRHQESHTTGTSSSAAVQQKDAKQNISKEQDKALEEKKARAFVISDIDADLDHINKRLNSQGLHWLSTGYVSMWDRVNKADEAMIDLLPRERVVESAKLDELRLINSGVPDSENLLKLLKKAIETLSSQKVIGTASSDTNGPKPSSEQKQESNLAQNMAQAMLALLKKAALPPNPSPPQSEQEARADVRQVKAALHDFTNKRWDGLVRARNVLVVTAFLTSVFVYILVSIAILADIPTLAIEQAIVFYIVGAIVGLFKRLYDEKDTDNAVDDYGLTMTRIIVTPLLSGLAAIVGVFLVTFLSITITPQNGSPSRTPVMIVDIYNFSKNPQNLVFAAIFGYVPNLVLSILQSKSEDIKGQLKSVSPTDNSETVSKGNGIGSTAKAKIGK